MSSIQISGVMPPCGEATPRAACDTIHLHMNRLRALLLLGTLLTSPVGGLAWGAASAADCCGGTMCPMHREPKSPHEKKPGQTNDSPRQTCMCGPGQRTRALLPQLTPEAILTAHPILFQRAITHEGVAFTTGAVLIRSAAPPDQPPRL